MLLLVILGMLTLFLMIGTAFVVSSNQYRRANKSYAKVGEQENLQASQDGFLGEVINQIIRDTTNQNSALRFHSLLRDLYGTEGFRGEVNVPGTPGTPAFLALCPKFAGAIPSSSAAELSGPTNRQFIEFSVYDSTSTNDPERPRDFFGNFYTLSQMTDYYAGQLLTWTTGPMAGKSARIIKYRYDSTLLNGIFTVMATPTDNGQILEPISQLLPGSRSPMIRQLSEVVEGDNPGPKFVINGRPFNGTGVGYNALAAATDPKLNAAENVLLNGVPTPFPIALMPNTAFFDPLLTSSVLLSAIPVPGALTYYGTTAANTPLPGYRFYDGLGGSDESYDAPDFQNMYLAWTSPTPQETIFPNLASTPNPDNPLVPFTRTSPPPYLGGIVLPSFHRPELINHWAFHPTTPIDLTAPANASMLRKVLLRPSWLDHPEFNGSNPEFAEARASGQAIDPILRMIYGPWDVDNDMDGIRDSVWVDFGAPVMVGASGKLVKPLAAIMVLDMDGRLNVNAHGTRELAEVNGEPNEVNFAGGIESDDAPRGQAYGPAEITLGDILGNKFDNLFIGGSWFGTFWPGRYAGDEEPGYSQTAGLRDFDLSAQLKMQGFPTSNYVRRSNYGTFPDLRGRYSIGLNDFGQSITDWSVNDYADKNNNNTFDPGEEVFLDADNPYELDLSSTGPRGASTSVDNPFSTAELERVLRAYDIDAGTLSPRLYELLKGGDSTPNINDLNAWRTLLTTDSYDLPEPGVQLPAWVRTNALGANKDFVTVMERQPINATFADLIEYRLRASQTPTWLPSEDMANPTRLPLIQRQMSMLIAPEMMAGLKLDLNRPLGNSRDDDANPDGTPRANPPGHGYGVVDEPGEFFDADGNGRMDPNELEAYWAVDRTRLSANSANNAALNPFENGSQGFYRDDFDRNGDGTIEPWEWGDTNGDGSLSRTELVNLHNYRRQLLARHLYVLAYALIDPLPLTSTGVLADNSKIKALQLAQWAVNAVDFSDPDNIMTAFEYDANPFDGWDVDGDLTTTVDVYGTLGKIDLVPPPATPPAQKDIGGVVWGMENPELLMTEAIAWHDRRTEDTVRENIDPDQIAMGRTNQGSVEDTGPNRDPHLDQQYRPKGAAFIELYNPGTASPTASADTHAIHGVNFDAGDVNLPEPADGTDLGINLSAVAIDPVNSSLRSPVWRIQVLRNRKKETPTKYYYPQDIKEILALYDPDDLSSLPTNNRPDVDRTIYFAREGGGGVDAEFPNNAPVAGTAYEGLDQSDGVEFFTNLPVRPVRPGTYMVVGGGDEDAPGVYKAPIGLTFVNGDSLLSNKIGRRIELHANVDLYDTAPGAQAPIQMFNAAGPAGATTLTTPRLFSATGPFVADVAIINRVIERTKTGTPVGPANRTFSLSEPPNGYPNNYLGSVWSTTTLPANAPEVDGWYVEQENPSKPLPIDIPLDDNTGAVEPTDPDLRTYGTVQGYRWLYLQRLANPLLPFNPEAGQPGHVSTRPVNPYKTIDQTSVNLSVFNGLLNAAILSPSVNPENGTGADPGMLSSVERGWRNNAGDLMFTDFLKQKDTHTAVNPYQIENSGLRPRNNTVFPAGSKHYFNAAPDCTLGFLNRSFNNDFVNDRNDPMPGKPKLNIPDQPMPWLTWNNRPYANPGELLQVPAVRSSQLMKSFSFLEPTSLENNKKQEVYNQKVNDGPTKPNPANPYLNRFKHYFTNWDGPYTHVLNFFRATMGVGIDTVPNSPDDEGIAGLYRVLDFVTVPSPFVGTDVWLSPVAFGNQLADAVAPNRSPLDPRYGLQPPFNQISSRRDPGRVNINTITNGAVWHGLFHGSAKRNGIEEGHPVMDDDGFASIRRGYGTLGDNPTLLNANSPTLFANPFRASGTGEMVPLVGLRRSDTESTLMRSTGVPPLVNTTPVPQADPVGVPLFTADTTDDINTPDPQIENKHRDSNRNPYFRYSPISRLSSMTTTRSNVFAIWVTIGFFEVEEADRALFNTNNPTSASFTAADQDALFARVYPDGYTFTKEAGIDTGEIQRVREFAIVDRTIPAAFEPGANHNTEETVRLRRKIE